MERCNMTSPEVNRTSEEREALRRFQEKYPKLGATGAAVSYRVVRFRKPHVFYAIYDDQLRNIGRVSMDYSRIKRVNSRNREVE